MKCYIVFKKKKVSFGFWDLLNYFSLGGKRVEWQECRLRIDWKLWKQRQGIQTTFMKGVFTPTELCCKMAWAQFKCNIPCKIYHVCFSLSILLSDFEPTDIVISSSAENQQKHSKNLWSCILHFQRPNCIDQRPLYINKKQPEKVNSVGTVEEIYLRISNCCLTFRDKREKENQKRKGKIQESERDRRKIRERKWYEK